MIIQVGEPEEMPQPPDNMPKCGDFVYEPEPDHHYPTETPHVPDNGDAQDSHTDAHKQ